MKYTGSEEGRTRLRQLARNNRKNMTKAEAKFCTTKTYW